MSLMKVKVQTTGIKYSKVWCGILLDSRKTMTCTTGILTSSQKQCTSTGLIPMRVPTSGPLQNLSRDSAQ